MVQYIHCALVTTHLGTCCDPELCKTNLPYDAMRPAGIAYVPTVYGTEGWMGYTHWRRTASAL